VTSAAGKGWFSDVASFGDLGWDPAKREITLFILGGAGYTASKSDVATNVAINVAIEGIETLGGKSAVSVLDAARNEVERVLMATEAECRRLGFQIE
jgi:hypothetical protein